MNVMERRLLTVATVFAAAVLGAATTLGQAAGIVGLALAAGFCGLALLGAERLGIVALAGAFATAPMYRGIGTLGPLMPTDLLLAVGLLLLLPVVLQRRWSDVPSHFVMAVGALVVLGLLALPRAASASTSFVFLVQWLLMFGALPIFLALWRPRLAVIDGLLRCYLAGQFVSTAYGFLAGASVANRMLGLSHHPNDFGLAAAVSVAIIFYLLPHCRTPSGRYVLAALIVVNVVGLLLSGSRGATLAVAFVVVLVPLVERSGLWAFVVGLGGALGLALLPLLIGLGGSGGALARLSGDDTAQASDTVREGALTEGWHRFLDSPFIGSGLDEAVGAYHNLYLEVAVAFGAIAVLAYVIACLILVWPVLSNHPLRRLGYLPALFLVAGVTFPGIIDRTVVVPMAMAMFAVVPAVGTRADRGPHAADDRRAGIGSAEALPDSSSRKSSSRKATAS